ncbi:MAG TPA: hypothetical protein VMG13_06495 [Trebonia sp.]|nr:hypothetical protein [Trebonia sp.]
MGLFGKKQKIAVCEMCGKADLEGCGSIQNHVEQISVDQPAWLPANLRAQAPGEYTWMCLRCSSYPSVKWPHDSGAWAGMMLHLGGAHYVGEMKGIGGANFTMIPLDQTPVAGGRRDGPSPAARTSPADPGLASASAVPAAPAAPANSEEGMTREMAYSLAALCEEASRLYNECIEKTNDSEKARALSQTDYVNGVQQHPISKRTFASMADGLEGELTSLLRKLHEVSAQGESVWSNFMFLAGGPNSDFSTAMMWCTEHGIDSSTVSSIAVDGLFLRCDFGLTKASFLKENDRLTAAMESNQQ